MRIPQRGRVVVPALVAGVGVALSLPPWGFWVLAFPAVGLLWWRLDGLRMRARLLAGFVAGLGLFGTGLWWVLSFSGYGGAILMVVESLAFGLACALTPARKGRAAALTGAMVLAEALRSTWPFGGLPLGGIALGQAAGPLAGAARVGGPLLVVGLVWLGGSGLGHLAAAVRSALSNRSTSRNAGGWGPLAEHAATLAESAAAADPTDPTDPADPTDPTEAASPVPLGYTPPPSQLQSASRQATLASAGGRRVSVARPAGAGVVCLAAVVAVATWGAVAPDGGRVLSSERVAVVQGGGTRGVRRAEVSPTDVYDAQLSATSMIGAHDGGRAPVLVVWPEDVVALAGLLTGSPINGQLSSLAHSLHATLVVGVTESVSLTTFRNEEIAYAPSGRLVARYEKVHRVPFGEYVPWRSFFSHVANLSAVPQDAIAGHGDGVLHTPAGALGTMISYEVFFAERGWVATRAGARLLVVPTNTASYSNSQVPTQEVAADRLQAIAEGRDLVQAATTGFSTFVNNRGAVITHTILGRRQVLVVEVGLRSGRTVYERMGDIGALVAAMVLLAAGWFVQLFGGGSSPAAQEERRAIEKRKAARVATSATTTST